MTHRVARLDRATRLKVLCWKATCTGLVGRIRVWSSNDGSSFRTLEFPDESWYQAEDGVCRKSAAQVKRERHADWVAQQRRLGSPIGQPNDRPRLRRPRFGFLDGTDRVYQGVGAPRFLPTEAVCPVCKEPSTLDPVALDVRLPDPRGAAGRPVPPNR